MIGLTCSLVAMSRICAFVYLGAVPFRSQHFPVGWRVLCFSWLVMQLEEGGQKGLTSPI